jgi:WD40 repeat protein
VVKALPALADKQEDGRPPIMPNSLALSPDGRFIAVGGGGSTEGNQITLGDERTFFKVRVLGAKTGELVWSHIGRRGYLEQLAFSPDGRTLACATSLDVRLLDARTGDLKQTLNPKAGTVWAVAFSPDNRFLAGCGTATVEERRSRRLTLWDLRSGAIVRSIEAGDAGGATAPGTLAFSPDGKSLASAGVGTAVLLGRTGGRVVGQKVINDVRLWDVATGELTWTSAQDDGMMTSLVFSPDGEALLCCDDSATSRIDARTGQNRQNLMEANDGRTR